MLLELRVLLAMVVVIVVLVLVAVVLVLLLSCRSAFDPASVQNFLLLPSLIAVPGPGHVAVAPLLAPVLVLVLVALLAN